MAAVAGWRIGITQRHQAETDDRGPRDALDSGWSDWMQQTFPGDRFIAIPNFSNPDDSLGYAQAWRLNALILAGGEDVGSSARRDEVERTLLRHAGASGWPVLGVCRGMQMLHLEDGGTLQEVSGHTDGRHAIEHADGRCEVNSRHRWGIQKLRPGWRSLAVGRDGTVEAAQCTKRRWLGLMWHPERDAGAPAICSPWLRTLFERRPALGVG